MAPAQGPRIRCYVSAHGFGHATRVAAVLRALGALAPEARVEIRSAAPAALFLAAMPLPLEILHQTNDVGVVQSDGLTLDGAETIRRYARFLDAREPLVAAEANSTRAAGIDLIFGDIPPLAFAVAARAGIPAVAMGNFDWHWIYGEWAHQVAGGERVLAALREDYGNAELLLRLPCCDRMEAFPRVRDVPLVGRRARLDPAEARRRAGIPEDAGRVALLSFGGMGLRQASWQRLGAIPGHHFVSVGALQVPGGTHLQEWELGARGLLYEDLVAAADLVVTKPGYGIVSECAVNRTAMLYTERGTFREYPIMVREMRRYFPAVYVSPEEVRRGELAEALRRLAASPWPAEPPASDGAEIVAAALLEFAARSKG
jgi:L-arabinokinase